MQADTTVRFRVDAEMRRLLDRRRDEKDINVSAWVRRQLRAALEREFPGAEITEPRDSETTPGAEAPQPTDATPFAGWKPRREVRRRPRGRQSRPGLPDDDRLRGATISVTDSKGGSWNTTILEVVGRTEPSILVRTSSRPTR